MNRKTLLVIVIVLVALAVVGIAAADPGTWVFTVPHGGDLGIMSCASGSLQLVDLSADSVTVQCTALGPMRIQ